MITTAWAIGEVMGSVEPVGGGIGVAAAGGGDGSDQPECAGDTAHRDTVGRIDATGTVSVVGGEVVGCAGGEVFPNADSRGR
jgi:hypothetical protein